MNLKYLLLRVTRHFLPDGITRFLLRRGWIIRPGLETRAPEQAVDRYLQVLKVHGADIRRKRLLVFGYGGRFSVGVKLLQHGASHVLLCDQFAPPDHQHNRGLIATGKKYLIEKEGKVLPHPEYITVVQEDICAVAKQQRFTPVDAVLSSSVYEHLPALKIDDITAALSAMTQKNGVHIHFVDLRDHYFKYPFEMLTYSKNTWERWLNPTSNLNRFRFGDYLSLFENHFRNVEIEILERDENTFTGIQSRIRPEYKSGDILTDSVTQIMVFALQGEAKK